MLIINHILSTIFNLNIIIGYIIGITLLVKSASCELQTDIILPVKNNNSGNQSGDDLIRNFDKLSTKGLIIGNETHSDLGNGINNFEAIDVNSSVFQTRETGFDWKLKRSHNNKTQHNPRLETEHITSTELFNEATSTTPLEFKARSVPEVSKNPDANERTLYIGGLFDVERDRENWLELSDIVSTKVAIQTINKLNFIPNHKLELIVNSTKVR